VAVCFLFFVSLLPGLNAHCLSTYRQCRGRPSGPRPRVCPPVAQAGPKRPHPTARSARHAAPPRAPQRPLRWRPLERSCSHVAPQWRQPPRGSAPTTPRCCGSHAIHRPRSSRPVQSGLGHRQFPNPGEIAPLGWATVISLPTPTAGPPPDAPTAPRPARSKQADHRHLLETAPEQPPPLARAVTYAGRTLFATALVGAAPPPAPSWLAAADAVALSLSTLTAEWWRRRESCGGGGDGAATVAAWWWWRQARRRRGAATASAPRAAAAAAATAGGVAR